MPNCIEHGVRQIEEGAGRSGTDIIDAAGGIARGEPKQELDTVLDIDEVALLRAMGIAFAVGAKQLDREPVGNARVIPCDHALHAAFMIFIRPIDIEEFETVPACWGRPDTCDLSR